MYNCTGARWVKLSEALDLLTLAGIPGNALTTAQRSGDLPYRVINGEHRFDPVRLANVIAAGRRTHGK